MFKQLCTLHEPVNIYLQETKIEVIRSLKKQSTSNTPKCHTNAEIATR